MIFNQLSIWYISAEWKEGNGLFNNTLNTFYLRTTKMIQQIHWCHFKGYFLIKSKSVFYISTERIVHTMAFDTPVVEHWLVLEILNSISMPIETAISHHLSLLFNWFSVIIFALYFSPIPKVLKSYVCMMDREIGQLLSYRIKTKPCWDICFK